jgi:hypothetical protein
LPAVLHAAITVLAAAEEHGEETSKTLFYVCGGLLAVFAVVISAIGISRHDSFPPTKGAARAVMGLAALLVVLAMASAVVTG